MVSADGIQLWRVFSNLIGKAIKHNPPGLTITLNAKFAAGKIICTITENGVGMTQQQCERLFDPYAWGNQLGNSLSFGLGLYLCKQIIHAHGGKIGVKNTVEVGTTFWLSLQKKELVESQEKKFNNPWRNSPSVVYGIEV